MQKQATVCTKLFAKLLVRLNKYTQPQNIDRIFLYSFISKDLDNILARYPSEIPYTAQQEHITNF